MTTLLDVSVAIGRDGTKIYGVSSKDSEELSDHIGISRRSLGDAVRSYLDSLPDEVPVDGTEGHPLYLHPRNDYTLNRPFTVTHGNLFWIKR